MELQEIYGPAHLQRLRRVNHAKPCDSWPYNGIRLFTHIPRTYPTAGFGDDSRHVILDIVLRGDALVVSGTVYYELCNPAALDQLLELVHERYTAVEARLAPYRQEDERDDS